MNVALWNKKRQEYYVACVRRSDKGYETRGKRISVSGQLLELCQSFYLDTVGEVERRCRELARTKVRVGGYVEMALKSLPVEVQGHLEVPLDMQLTQREMVEFISKSRRERYVTLKDVWGMEDWFDAGVEYVGYESDEDDDVVLVHDRFGRLRNCFRARLGSISETEVSRQLGAA